MHKLVSIIMPAYNAAAHIAEAIESVLNQTYSDWELCVVDDGSTDDTKRIVLDYCNLDKRVKYIYQENARQGRARNNGIKYTSGEYIAFLDSDDIWLPEKLCTQLKQIDASDAALVFCNSYTFTGVFNLVDIQKGVLPLLGAGKGTFVGNEGIMSFLLNNRIPILTVLMKRSALVSVGGFTESKLVQNAEDYHLWLKLLLSGFAVVGYDCVLTAYRKHNSSVSDIYGQNLKQVVEAKVDLATIYPKYREVILATVNKTILLSLFSVSKFESDKFFDTIYRYLQISKKDLFQPFFKVFEKIGSRQLALKSIYFIYNYL